MREKLLQIVDWTGAYFEFDARYFAKNSLWVLTGQFMMSLIAFAVTVALANFVSKKELGDYRLIISLFTTLTFFTMSGLSQAFIRAIVNKKDGALQEAFEIKKRYGIITFLIGTCLAIYFGIYRGNMPFGLSIFIMSVSLPLIELYSLYFGYLQGKHEFKFTSISQGVMKVISGIAVILAAIFTPSAVFLVLALYGTQVVLTFLYYRYTLRKHPPENKDIDPSMKNLAQHMTLSGVPVMLFGQADKFILYHFFGPVALASYWIASAVPQEVGRVMSTISQVAFPKLVQGKHQVMRVVVLKKLYTITAVLVFVSFLYAFIAYPFFSLFLPQYMSEIGKSIMLMFSFAVIPYTFVWQYYAAQGNVKVVYISNTIDPVLQSFLFLLLIPFYGVWGLVYAVFIKMICMNLIAWYVLKTQ